MPTLICAIAETTPEVCLHFELPLVIRDFIACEEEEEQEKQEDVDPLPRIMETLEAYPDAHEAVLQLLLDILKEHNYVWKEEEDQQEESH